MQAALTTLFYSSRAAAAVIIRHATLTRPLAYDYGERYSNSRSLVPNPLCLCSRLSWEGPSPITTCFRAK